MLCTGLNSLVVCVKSPHSLVPRSFGFLTQTTRAYNPVRHTFYDVNYMHRRLAPSTSWYTHFTDLGRMKRWVNFGGKKSLIQMFITRLNQGLNLRPRSEKAEILVLRHPRGLKVGEFDQRLFFRCTYCGLFSIRYPGFSLELEFNGVENANTLLKKVSCL